VVSDPVPEEVVLARGQALDEIRRADTKAAMLLTLTTAVLAGLVAVSGHGPRGAWPVVTLTVLVVALLAAAVVVLLAALRPRMPHRDPVAGTWLHAAAVDAAGLLDGVDDTAADWEAALQGEPGGQAKALRIAEDTCRVAVLARLKLHRIGTAVRLIEVALAVLAAPVAVVVILR
jgi:hypothetical protein